VCAVLGAPCVRGVARSVSGVWLCVALCAVLSVARRGVALS
jgi:hypothetical protein